MKIHKIDKQCIVNQLASLIISEISTQIIHHEKGKIDSVV